MKVNPQITKTLDEIARQTNTYLNSPDGHRRYLKKLHKLYTTALTEEEQIYTLRLLLEQLSYKNIVTDPDTVLAIGNVKNRTIFVIFGLTVAGMIVASYLFTKDGRFAQLLDHALKLFGFVFKF